METRKRGGERDGQVETMRHEDETGKENVIKEDKARLLLD